MGKVIGERGKNVAEICACSKTKIVIPRPAVVNGALEPKVVIAVTGEAKGVQTALFLMQKAAKS